MTRNRLDIATTESTRYEVALMRDGKAIHVYGFTARKAKQGILELMTEDVTHLLTPDELNACDTHQLNYSRKLGLSICPGIRVGFTGRTERDAAMEAKVSA